MSDFPTYQPLSEYKNRFYELHKNNSSDFFENCIKLGNINEEANKKTVEQINQQKVKITKTSSSLNKKRALNTFLIIIIVVASCIFLSFSYMVLQKPELQSFLVIAGSGGLAVYLYPIFNQQQNTSIII